MSKTILYNIQNNVLIDNFELDVYILMVYDEIMDSYDNNHINKTNKYCLEIINELILHFSNKEDYEKCQHLCTLKKEIWN